MKKKIIAGSIISIIFIAVLTFFISNWYIHQPQSSDQEFIKIALEAEKRLTIVHFCANPDLLKQKGFEPRTIVSKKDVVSLLSPYWDESTINRVWKNGSSYMPKLPFGYYTELDFGLADASNIKVVKKEQNKVVISGLVKNLDGQYTKYLTLIRTKSGWQAIDGN